MFEIHISDIRTYRQCRRRWDFSSPLRQNMEPNITYAPFFTGRAIHHAMEQYYGHGRQFKFSVNEFIADEVGKMGNLWPQERDKIAEQIGLIDGMMEHYKLWIERHESRWSDDKLQFVALETEFRVPLRNPKGRKSTRVFLAGRFDGVVVHKDDGTYWLWEIKTTRSINEMYKSLQLDEQCGAYIYAAEELLGVPISGVLYTLIRKKIPTIPRILQSGELSKAKNIDTTADVYLQTIRQTFPELSMEEIYHEYGDILTEILNRGNEFFLRVPIYRTRKEIDLLASNLWYTALEMTRPSTWIYPSPGWSTCTFCPFRSPCIAMSAGMDYGFILDAEFRQRVSYSAKEEVDETDNN